MNSSKTSNVNEEAKAKIDTKKRIIIKDNVITRTKNEGNQALDTLIRNEEHNKKPTSELIDAKIKSLTDNGYCFIEYRKDGEGNESFLDSKADENKIIDLVNRYWHDSNRRQISDEFDEPTSSGTRSTCQLRIKTGTTDKEPSTDDIKFEKSWLRNEDIVKIIDDYTKEMGQPPNYKILLHYVNTVVHNKQKFFMHNKKTNKYDLIPSNTEADKTLLAKYIARPHPSSRDVCIKNGDKRSDIVFKNSKGAIELDHLVHECLKKGYGTLSDSAKRGFVHSEVLIPLLEVKGEEEKRKVYRYDKRAECYKIFPLDSKEEQNSFLNILLQRVRDANPSKKAKKRANKKRKVDEIDRLSSTSTSSSTIDTQSSNTSLKTTASTEIKDSQAKVCRREHEDSLLDPLDYHNPPNFNVLKDFGLENINSSVQTSDDRLSSSSTSSSTINTQSSNISLKRTAPTEIKAPQEKVCKIKHDCREPLSSASSITITDNIQRSIFLGKVNIPKTHPSEDTIVVGTDGIDLDQNLQDGLIEEKNWTNGAGTTDDALSSNKDDHANDENELPSPSLFLDCD